MKRSVEEAEEEMDPQDARAMAMEMSSRRLQEMASAELAEAAAGMESLAPTLQALLACEFEPSELAADARSQVRRA
jgi:protein subunit release factor A